MATVVLSDEQVMDLVLQLPLESKRFLLEAFQAESEPVREPEIADKEGLLVVRASLLQDLSDVVEREQESRVAALLDAVRE